MIIYFSATGNSKYVAERIARELNDTAISIIDCIETETYDFTLSDGEKIGIVSPTAVYGARRSPFRFRTAAFR